MCRSTTWSLAICAATASRAATRATATQCSRPIPAPCSASTTCASDQFRPLLERLGWAKQGFGLHSFRRSYVSALIANGLDVANVSKYAGHASPTITLDRYAREFEARKRDDDRVREVTAGLWSATSKRPELRQLATPP